MFDMLKGILAGACLLAASSVAVSARDLGGRTAMEHKKTKSLTILVLLDGFRPDYLDRGVTPNMSELVSNGVRGAITPAFPSVTFPNHFAQITGLYPDQHGIVGNVFEDPLMPAPFNPFKDVEYTKDSRWWSAGVPLWALAEEQGLKVTRTQWVVNGYDRQGRGGSNHVPLEYTAPPERGADRFLQWFDGNAKDAPDLSLLYFPQADSAGHKYGPDSPQTNAAIAQLDAAIGKVVAGLKKRRLWNRVNIVLTADHGMAKFVPGQVIFLDDLADPKTFRLIGDGPYAEVVPEASATVDGLASKLAGSHGAMTCWRKQDLPTRFHFGENVRVAPILCLADPGWAITKRSDFNPTAWLGASHGYDPESSSMAALFLAQGPAFCTGKSTLQRIDAVDIYSLIASLAGIRPGANSGNLSNFNRIMRAPGNCEK